MNFHKIAQYLYLIIAILFLTDTVIKFMDNESDWWISLLFCLAAVFMFFFKRKFVKNYKK